MHALPGYLVRLLIEIEEVILSLLAGWLVAYKEANSSNFLGIICCPPLCALSLACFSGSSSFGSLRVACLQAICKRADGCAQ
jgi:hypothetical protein